MDSLNATNSPGSRTPRATRAKMAYPHRVLVRMAMRSSARMGVDPYNSQDQVNLELQVLMFGQRFSTNLVQLQAAQKRAGRQYIRNPRAAH